jgi:hypothetical protein
MIPQRVHIIRGPNVGTGTSSDHWSALRIAQWWHSQHDMSSDRTPRLPPFGCSPRPRRQRDAGCWPLLMSLALFEI